MSRDLVIPSGTPSSGTPSKKAAASYIARKEKVVVNCYNLDKGLKYRRVFMIPHKYKYEVLKIIGEEGFPLEWQNGGADYPEYSTLWSWVPDWWYDKDNNSELTKIADSIAAHDDVDSKGVLFREYLHSQR